MAKKIQKKDLGAMSRHLSGRGEWPISPHLGIIRPNFLLFLSISHRCSEIVLAAFGTAVSLFFMADPQALFQFFWTFPGRLFFCTLAATVLYYGVGALRHLLLLYPSTWLYDPKTVRWFGVAGLFFWVLGSAFLAQIFLNGGITT